MTKLPIFVLVVCATLVASRSLQPEEKRNLERDMLLRELVTELLQPSTRASVADRVKAVVAETIEVPLSSVTPEARFDKLGADEQDMVELQYEISQEFNTNISDKDAEYWTTVGDIIKQLSK